MSWASQLIASGREEMIRLLSGKKYVLIVVSCGGGGNTNGGEGTEIHDAGKWVE